MDANPNGTLEQQIAALRARVERLEATMREHGIVPEMTAVPAPQSVATAQTPPPLSSASPTHAQAPSPERSTAPSPSSSPGSSPSSSPSPSPSSFRQPSADSSRSLESRIGSQWFNRIGILAVLIGMAWFLKLAIDNHWIGPAARVLIGIVAGVALVAWSERFRTRGYIAFSYSLKAAGSGILYLSLWAAYSIFHLVATPLAFVAMVLVTASNGLMSWTQDSELLALYALIGGYITPLLLSNGENHQLPLFAYLLLLNLATLILVILRPWSRLLAAAFIGTFFYAATWSLAFYNDSQFASTVFFLSIYFLLFAFAPRLVRAAAHSQDAFALIALPLANAAFGFAGFYLLLDNPSADGTQSWVAALFAAFYFLLMTLPSHFLSESPSTTRSQLKSLDLVTGIAFLAFAVGRAIHHYWWHVRYNGDRTLINDYSIYAQFTYSACFMLFGAALLLIGFARRSPFLRWQALLVLAITIAKVFLVDLTQLTQGYRIVSFLGLGALLLAISFIYQRDWLNLRSPK
jgi:uncharacterized membrane protein